MEKAYERQYFSNDSTPELSGDNINKIDRAVDVLDDRIIEIHINVSGVIEEEKIRVKNEEKRKQDETIRQTQEKQRQQDETVRQTQEKQRQQDETIRQTQEKQRKQDETIRQTQEKQRQQDETIRQTQEKQRQQDETIRQTQEKQRQQDETIRQTQEKQRQQDETDRQMQEGKRQQDTAKAVKSAEEATAAAKEMIGNLYKGLPKFQINFEDGCLYYCGATKFTFLVNRETGDLDWGLTA